MHSDALHSGNKISNPVCNLFIWFLFFFTAFVFNACVVVSNFKEGPIFPSPLYLYHTRYNPNPVPISHQILV
uniref:Uncharacterized protein n=1 Tax=Anguilla anguilla TaxID=7936 RepID=A0A0E9X2T1_ANGAN